MLQKKRKPIQYLYFSSSCVVVRKGEGSNKRISRNSQNKFFIPRLLMKIRLVSCFKTKTVCHIGIQNCSSHSEFYAVFFIQIINSKFKLRSKQAERVQKEYL